MNLNKLLQDTPEAHYWAGFLMADGCFSKDKDKEYYRLILSLADKDKYHVYKFMRFMETKKKYHNTSNSYTATHYNSKDGILFKNVMNKFSFHFRKTYNPPNGMEILDDDLFISFLIGFIDGDGYIQEGKNTISIQCHYVWYECLSKWFLRLQNLSETHLPDYKKNKVINCYIEKKKSSNKIGKYARIRVSREYIIKFLSGKIKELKLPILKRKWDKIKFSSPNGDYQRIQKVIELLEKGYKNSDILKILKIKGTVNRSYVSRIKRRIMEGKG